MLAVRQMRSYLDDTAAAAVRRQVQAKENLMSVIITAIAVGGCVCFARSKRIGLDHFLSFVPPSR